MLGDFPVGALITSSESILGNISNSKVSNNDWCSHAESLLIREYAPIIRKEIKSNKKVTLYTTLEPCLMCLGTSVMNRVSRIVYACPGPCGEATGLDTKVLPE